MDGERQWFRYAHEGRASVSLGTITRRWSFAFLRGW